MKKINEKMAEFFEQIYVGEKKVIVYGDGNADAEIMMIGEAPGEQETLMGRPFVGKAGKNLDEFLDATGIDRGELYITNVVKFRPVRISEAGRAVNRPPNAEEIKLCLPWLQKEIEEVDPKYIVTLGNVPLKALLGREVTIGALHGQWREYSGRRLFPLYHPASIIYNRSLREVYEADVRRLADEIHAGD